MGMFDRVFANCPNCARQLEFQSKGGQCQLNEYDAEHVPIDVAGGMSWDTEECICGKTVKLTVPEHAWHVRMEPKIVD